MLHICVFTHTQILKHVLVGSRNIQLNVNIQLNATAR